MLAIVETCSVFLLLTSSSYLLARLPRRLVEADVGLVHERRLELGLAAGLVLLSCAVFVSDALAVHDMMLGTTLSLTATTLAAVIYYDFRFLVIPDLYIFILAALALVQPAGLPLRDAIFAAAVCGALVGAVAWLWKSRTGVEGMGLGDVKLSAALGALLGLESALWTITVAAFTGAVFGYVYQALDRWRGGHEAGSTIIPFGAILALAGAGFFFWAHR